MRFNDLTRIQDEIEEEIDPDVAFYSDMRRHRMTLEHVNRLRKLRELRKYEQKKLTLWWLRSRVLWLINE